jgi:uncharacterized protein (UPF0147 family)
MNVKKIRLSDDLEAVYFQKQEQEIVKNLREKAEEEADKQYREEHQGHCFRCGTASLVEVEKGNVKIDICVNEGCGAVHLDPGELDEIIKDKSVISNVRLAIFNVFK